MNSAQDDEYLTVAEIAARLKVNPQTVRNWIARRELRAARVGARRVRIPFLRSEAKPVGRNVAKSLHTGRIPRSPARFASWQQGQLRAAIFTSPRVAKPPSRLIWTSSWPLPWAASSSAMRGSPPTSKTSPPIEALAGLGVATERIYDDPGLTGTTRARPGLREALAACHDGDTSS